MSAAPFGPSGAPTFAPPSPASAAGPPISAMSGALWMVSASAVESSQLS